MKESYTSASQIPMKLLRNSLLMKEIKYDKRIPPIHVQWMPTNRCNLSCSFCSCGDRDKTKEMDIDKAFKVIVKLKKLGMEAVTITGGGEPLLHPQIVEMIHYFYNRKVKIGLVTNGTLLEEKSSILKYLTWCRISEADTREVDLDLKMLKRVVTNNKIDWAFSYVLNSYERKNKKIERLLNFANDNNFTHMRIVSDIFTPHHNNFKHIKEYINRTCDASKVIYQPRTDYTRGNKCYICYIKPVIDADFKVYTCCGAQYATTEQFNYSRKMSKKLCIGNALKFDKIYKNSNKPFDGRVCVKCYYGHYNYILNNLMQNIEHREFI